MLECRACTVRAIRAIAGDTLNVRRSRLARPTASFLTPDQNRRFYADSAAIALRTGDTGLNEDIEGMVGSAAARAATKKQYDASIKKEMQWLSDPLKHSEHVHYTLRCNQSAKALDLCRLASRSMNCVVSWNHIVDWLMKQGLPDDAIKVYNEMKKRAQFPDSYTYMLLLRGLVRSSPLLGEDDSRRKRAGERVTQAVHIYNSMAAASCRVQPTIMHTNAVLKVCSSADDLDAFWGIAGKIPERGPGAADHITYTTILDAIRHGTINGLPEDYSEREMFRYRMDGMDQAMRLWSEIIAKWRSGDVKIDDELVAAMGRVLLLGPHIKQWDKVLDLVQQTMNIERLVSEVGSSDRRIDHLAPEPAEFAELEEVEAGPTPLTPAESSFRMVKPMPPSSDRHSKSPSLMYASPGNSTLSVLIEVCQKMRIPKTLNAYWDRLTKECGVKPDVANFNALLVDLYVNRQSGRAASIIREMIATETIPTKTSLVKAMSVCGRDNRNTHAIQNATVIINAMDTSLADADPNLCMKYLRLAQSTKNGPKIVLALNALDPAVHNLMSYVSYGPAGGRKITVGADLFHKEMTLLLLQTMVGMIDDLIRKAMVPREDLGHFYSRRKALTSFVTRATNNLVHVRAKLPQEVVDGVREVMAHRKQQPLERPDRSSDMNSTSLDRLSAQARPPRQQENARVRVRKVMP